jgi:hypothetical protein
VVLVVVRGMPVPGPGRRMMWGVSRRTSLAGRLLFFQLALVSDVVLVLAAVSLAQSRYTFKSATDRRVCAVAEHIAGVPVLRCELGQPGGGLRRAPVLEDLRRHPGGVSASECADELGASRVSVRRHLENFTTTGRAEVQLRHGTAGRPEHRDTWRDPA